LKNSECYRRYTISAKERLCSGDEIRKVLYKGKRFSGAVSKIYFLANSLDTKRFTIITSKHLGNSVRRNRLRRLFREAMRLNKYSIRDGLDIVIKPTLPAPKHGIKSKLTYAEIEKSFLLLCAKAGILKGSIK